MPSVIINADDFGLSPGVNRGILEAFENGVLTSTTLLANLDHFDEAVQLAREHPELPVGVHLSLLWGPPISPPGSVRSLVEQGALEERFSIAVVPGEVRYLQILQAA